MASRENNLKQTHHFAVVWKHNELCSPEHSFTGGCAWPISVLDSNKNMSWNIKVPHTTKLAFLKDGSGLDTQKSY